jgi:hypothetical protein
MYLESSTRRGLNNQKKKRARLWENYYYYYYYTYFFFTCKEEKKTYSGQGEKIFWRRKSDFATATFQYNIVGS